MEYTNLGYLKALSQGDNEFVLKTINAFIKELKETTGKMQKCLLYDDLSRLSVLAHSMKASIDLFGIKVLVDSFKLIETCTDYHIDKRMLGAIIEEVTELSEEIIEELDAERHILEYNIEHDLN